MTDDAASRKTPHLGKCGNAANTPKKPHLASPPYRGEAMRHGDAGGGEANGRETAIEKKGRAVPVQKTDQVIDRVLAAVSEGTPLAEVCREPWAPHASTFYDWIAADAARQRDLARARESGHDLIAARARKIARGEEGSSKDVKRDRLIVDTDLKLLQAWDKRYRPAQVLAGDPEAPLVVPAFDPDQAAHTLLNILTAARARKETLEAMGLPPPDGSDLA